MSTDVFPGIDPATARAEIDLAAFRGNLAAIQRHVDDSRLMVVVKADGYGHGMLACAREARIATVAPSAFPAVRRCAGFSMP